MFLAYPMSRAKVFFVCWEEAKGFSYFLIFASVCVLHVMQLGDFVLGLTVA